MVYLVLRGIMGSIRRTLSEGAGQGGGHRLLGDRFRRLSTGGPRGHQMYYLVFTIIFGILLFNTPLGLLLLVLALVFYCFAG
jgi:hypothetical protein